MSSEEKGGRGRGLEAGAGLGDPAGAPVSKERGGFLFLHRF